MIRSLAQAAHSGALYRVIWAVSFIWLLFVLDIQPMIVQLFVAGFVAIPVAGLIGLLIGLPVVLLDIITDIISSVRQDIRAASDTTDKPRRRPLP